MKQLNLQMLIIDPQNDFCDPNGSLFVPGADEDMKRAGKLIKALKDKLYDIHITMDSHNIVDIAHPVYWVDQQGNEALPLNPVLNQCTIITHDDVKQGKWLPKDRSKMKWALEYTEKLELNGKNPLCIWPPHCIIGTTGWCIYPDVMEQINSWSMGYAIPSIWPKGSNPDTEHYSAFKADVETDDPTTKPRVELANKVSKSDITFLLGEASSHCLAQTMQDISDYFGEDNTKKIILVTDCCSPVPGFESMYEEFIKYMVPRGMQQMTSDEIIAKFA